MIFFRSVKICKSTFYYVFSKLLWALWFNLLTFYITVSTKSTSQNDARFICSQCYCAFSSNYALMSHQRERHQKKKWRSPKEIQICRPWFFRQNDTYLLYIVQKYAVNDAFLKNKDTSPKIHFWNFCLAGKIMCQLAPNL